MRGCPPLADDAAIPGGVAVVIKGQIASLACGGFAMTVKRRRRRHVVKRLSKPDTWGGFYVIYYCKRFLRFGFKNLR